MIIEFTSPAIIISPIFMMSWAALVLILRENLGELKVDLLKKLRGVEEL